MGPYIPWRQLPVVDADQPQKFGHSKLCPYMNITTRSLRGNGIGWAADALVCPCPSRGVGSPNPTLIPT